MISAGDGPGRIEGGAQSDHDGEFGALTVPAQLVEAMVNWQWIHGTPAAGGQYILVDPFRLAQIAGTTARFPLSPTDPIHAIFLEEGMQRYRDALGARGTDIQNAEQFERDWGNFWADYRNISRGMKEQVRQETLHIYVHLGYDPTLLRDVVLEYDVDSFKWMIGGSRDFTYYELLALQYLARWISPSDDQSGDQMAGGKARLAKDLMGMLRWNLGYLQMDYLFSMVNFAAQEGGTTQRLDLLIRLARILKTTTHVVNGAVVMGGIADNRNGIIAKTLDLLSHSQLTPEIEGDLANLIDKMLDRTTYPIETSIERDRSGHLLAKSSDIDKLILSFLDALKFQTTAAGSLPAGLLHVAADSYTRVNGAFIAVANLSLRQSATGGTLANYYGDPLFVPSVREKLLAVRFAEVDENGIDAFLEEEFWDSARGGASAPPAPATPVAPAGRGRASGSGSAHFYESSWQPASMIEASSDGTVELMSRQPSLWDVTGSGIRYPFYRDAHSSDSPSAQRALFIELSSEIQRLGEALIVARRALVETRIKIAQEDTSRHFYHLDPARYPHILKLWDDRESAERSIDQLTSDLRAVILRAERSTLSSDDVTELRTIVDQTISQAQVSVWAKTGTMVLLDRLFGGSHGNGSTSGTPPAPATPSAPSATPAPSDSGAASSAAYEEITALPDEESWDGEWDAAGEGDDVENETGEDPSLAELGYAILTGETVGVGMALP